MAIIFMAVTGGAFLAGCSDDPFYPRPPYYNYTAEVTGLENFTDGNGSATILLPIPAVDGEPVLKEGWWPNYRLHYDQERHGTRRIEPTDTARGPMLAITIDMTDYYYSYARVTSIAIYPGQNMSGLPTVVPDWINKSLSFDDFSVIASGFVSQLDYPTSPSGRQEVAKFLGRPLLPAMNVADNGYTSYIYLDKNLKPLKDNGTINISATLVVNLNHNKVNATEEGARSFEVHTFTINERIPAGVTGFIPVRVHYSYNSSPRYK